MSEPIGVLFVCLGNICRSPMAEGLFTLAVQQRSIQDRFVVESAGTAAYHVGELADPRTREVLRERGLKLRSRARRVADDDFTRFHYILGMDDSNMSGLRRRCPDSERWRLHKMLQPLGGADVNDPYYGGTDGFARNCAEIDAAIDLWIDRMLATGS